MCATTRTTIAHHESLTPGVEFVHDTDPRDTNRTVAVHESPVSERIRRAAHADTPRQLPCHQRRNADYPLGQAPPHRPQTGPYTLAGHPHPTTGYVRVFGMRNRGLTIPGSASRFLAAHWYID